MPGLSIIVPAGDDVSHFEDTLAAVLRNRPRACEVIVPHAGHYADPYELASEVWFIELAARATLEECLAHAIDKASGDVVHVLSPGCDFDDGWYQPAVAMFDDASVGCVSPVIEPAGENLRRGVNGVGYGLTGRYEVSGSASSKVLGPTYRAGFYRRTALKQIGGWPTTLPHRLADVDVALSLKQIGYRAVAEPQSLIRYSGDASTPSVYIAARQQERLFWRHRGGMLATLTRPIFAAYECLSIGGPASMFAAAAGKFASLADVASSRAHAARLQGLKRLTVVDPPPRSSDPRPSEDRPRRVA